MFVSYNLLFSFQIDYSKKKFFRFCLNTKPTQTLPGSQRWEADFLTGCFKSISVRCAISASARRFAGAKTAIRTVRLRRMTGVGDKCRSIFADGTRDENDQTKGGGRLEKANRRSPTARLVKLTVRLFWLETLTRWLRFGFFRDRFSRGWKMMDKRP